MAAAPVRHVLLDDQTGLVTTGELEAAAVALTAQANLDLHPYWGGHFVQVTADPQNIPPRIHPWLVTIMDKSYAGLGVHLDEHRHPYAEITYTSDWTVTASHELLEMLVDPWGTRMLPGPSLDPATGGRPVFYLVEVADPVEAASYERAGVPVSDFVTPSWYHAAAAGHGPFSLLGSPAGPWQVQQGGYVSWYDPKDGRWHQLLPGGRFVRSARAADLSGDARADKDAALADVAGHHPDAD